MNKQRGVTLVSAMIIGFLLVVVGSVTVQYVQSNGWRLGMDRDRQEALSIAESGVEWAIARFEGDNPQAVATADISFGRGTYSTTVTTLGTDRYLIQSAAYVPTRANPRASRAIQSVLFNARNPLNDYAMATDGDLTLTGNVTVNSTPATGQGNLRSNEDLDLNGGGINVDGDVEASGTASTGGATVTGSRTSGTEEIEIPAWSSTTITRMRNEAIASGSQDINTWGGTALQGHLSSYAGYDYLNFSNDSGKTLSISGGTITLNGTVFIDGQLKLSGNTIIQGNGTIITTEEIDISGSVKMVGINPTDRISVVSLSSDAPAMSLSGTPSGGGSSLGAFFYAPNGNIRLSGTVKVIGSLIANGVGIINGNVTVTRRTDREIDLPGFEYWTAQSWREVDVP